MYTCTHAHISLYAFLRFHLFNNTTRNTSATAGVYFIFHNLRTLTSSVRQSKTSRNKEFVYFRGNSPPPQWARVPSFTRFLDRTQRRTTAGRTPLGEWSARRRDLYLTTHNTHNRQTSMPLGGCEPTISAGERPQTYALDRSSTGICNEIK